MIEVGLPFHILNPAISEIRRIGFSKMRLFFRLNVELLENVPTLQALPSKRLHRGSTSVGVEVIFSSLQERTRQLLTFVSNPPSSAPTPWGSGDDPEA